MTTEVKLVGISGSPVAGGNVESVLEQALRGREGRAGVSFEMITLRGREVSDCRQCNWCLKRQDGERRCSIEDDMNEIYPMVEEADALIMATPVYFGRLSGHLACFIDRMRIYVHGNLTMGRLRNKVGGSIAVGWFRLAGIETALLSINQFFYAVNMIIAAPEAGLQGGALLSSLDGGGRRDGDDKLLALRDGLGMASALSTVERAVELARIMKAAPISAGGG